MKRMVAHVTDELKTHLCERRLPKADWEVIWMRDWSGNVGEFQNVLNRATHVGRFAEGLLEDEHRAEEQTEKLDQVGKLCLYCLDATDYVALAEEINRAYCRYVLGLFDGNLVRTAKALGIAPNFLCNHLKETN